MKQTSFATFAKSYKPLRFKFLGLTLQEHMPPQTVFDWPYLLRVRTKSLLGQPITYFDLRASMTPVGKKRADMAFLTHIIQKCNRDAENASRIERVRYFVTLVRYYPELLYIKGHLGTSKADKYMLRWGYLLEHDPSFDDLVHGLDASIALYAIENLE